MTREEHNRITAILKTRTEANMRTFNIEERQAFAQALSRLFAEAPKVAQAWVTGMGN